MEKNILRIGGRDPENKLRGIAVNQDGYLMIEGSGGASSLSSINQNLPLRKTTNITGERVLHLTYEGVAYCGSATLKKTLDFETYTPIHSFTTEIDYAFKLQNGSIFVVLSNGELWLSNSEEASFSLLTSELGGQGHPTNTHRASVHNNIILVGEYRTHGLLGNRVFISTDYGETFKISRLPEQVDQINHTHAIVYDPYESVIWVATGDDLQSCRVFWSHDFGKSWKTHNAGTYRMTTIMPLPDCVLFGTDESEVIGVYKYYRQKEGVKEDTFSMGLDFKAIYHEGAAIFGWTSTPSINYIDNPYAIFGYRMSHDYTPVGKGKIGVWKTDGEKYISLWEFDGANSKTPYGVSSVHGPDRNGRVIITWKNYDDSGFTDHVVIME